MRDAGMPTERTINYCIVLVARRDKTRFAPRRITCNFIRGGKRNLQTERRSRLDALLITSFRRADASRTEFLTYKYMNICIYQVLRARPARLIERTPTQSYRQSRYA